MSSSSSTNQQGSNNNNSRQPPQTQEQELKTNRNPITSDELQSKLKEIANDREKSARFQEQLAIKFRTEMQGYKYTPTDEFKDHPSLQPTDLELSKQQSPTQANTKLGETNLSNDQVINAVTPETNNPTIADNTTTQTAGKTIADTQKQQQEQQAQEAANAQQNPSQSVKG
jgi:hypothetical protein